MKKYLINTFTAFLIFTFIAFANEDKYELRSINFNGNSTISSSMLKDIIYSEESPGWFWKFLNSFTSFGKEPIYFDSSNIEIDLRALKDFYTNNGYFSASFSYNYKVDTSKHVVDLYYNIIEGASSKINNVDVYGLESVVLQYLVESKNVLSSLSGSDYSQNNVKLKIDEVIYYLSNNGYMLVSFDSTIIYKDTSKNSANLEIYFTPGKRYQINQIVVEKEGAGSENVEHSLISDIVGISAYEYYNLEKIRQSQSRLYRTGLFSSITIAPKIEDTLDTFVPLRVWGSIGLMHELGPEIIMNNQKNTFNIGLGASFTKKNFLGQARKLSLSGSFGLQDFFKMSFNNFFNRLAIEDTTLFGFVETRAKIEQPYVFNRPIFGILEGYYNINKDAGLASRNYGGKLSFEFEMPSYTFVSYLSAYFNLEVVKEIYNIAWLSSNVIYTRSSMLNIIGADVRSSKPDNPLFPTSGYNLSFLFEEANFFPYTFAKISGGDITDPSFYKTMVTLANYFPVGSWSNSVLGIKFKTGYLQTYHGNKSEVPSTRLFFAGGSNSVRGWRARELAPINSYYVKELNLFALVPGGTFLLEGTVEWRWRFSESIGSNIFLDYGNTWNGYKSFNFKDVAVAAGFGFRYYTMIAPFRIDFGFKTYDPYNNSSILKRKFFDVFEFHFGIGEAF